MCFVPSSRSTILLPVFALVISIFILRTAVVAAAVATPAKTKEPPATYFSNDQYVCVARNFTTGQPSVMLDLPQKVSNCVDIFCYHGRKYNLFHAFAKVKFIFAFPKQRSPNYHLHFGTYNEVKHAYVKQKRSTWSFTSVLPSISVWKLLGFSNILDGFWSSRAQPGVSESYQVSPFGSSCVGIDTINAYLLTFSNQLISLPLLTGYLFAIFMWLYANQLAPNYTFQYVSGTGTGMLLFVILILMYISRRVPKKAYALSGFLSIFSASVFAWFFNTFTNAVRSLATHHPLLIVSYFIITGLMSFMIIWWYGPIRNPRSVKAFGISLRGLAILMLLWCTNVPEVAVMTIFMLLLNDGRKFILEVPLFNRLWLRMQGTLGIKRTTREGLITSDEYEVEATVETQRALAELREQMANGAEWKKFKNRVHNPSRLTQFIFGNEDHVSPEETDAHNELVMLADDFYADVPPEDSDIEDNNTTIASRIGAGGGNDDTDNIGDVSMASTSSAAAAALPTRSTYALRNQPSTSSNQHYYNPQQTMPNNNNNNISSKNSAAGLYPRLEQLKRHFEFDNQNTPPLPKRINSHHQQSLLNHQQQHHNAGGSRSAFNLQQSGPSRSNGGQLLQQQQQQHGAGGGGLASRLFGGRVPVFGQRAVPSAPLNGSSINDDDDDDIIMEDGFGVPVGSSAARLSHQTPPNRYALPSLAPQSRSNSNAADSVSFTRNYSPSGSGTRSSSRKRPVR